MESEFLLRAGRTTVRSGDESRSFCPPFGFPGRVTTMTKDELEKVISMRFQEMPPKLRQAARYVLDFPKEVALQSMRTVAARAQLQPASMLRLARDLGFSSYEDFRSVYIDWLSAGPSGPSGLLERAELVREHSRASGDDQLLAESLAHEYGNLEATLSKRNEKSFHEAVDLPRNASQIYVLGLRSLYPPAFYLHYVLSTFQDNVDVDFWRRRCVDRRHAAYRQDRRAALFYRASLHGGERRDNALCPAARGHCCGSERQHAVSRRGAGAYVYRCAEHEPVAVSVDPARAGGGADARTIAHGPRRRGDVGGSGE